jgi:DNA-binding MarR family transcriptional regulator
MTTVDVERGGNPTLAGGRAGAGGRPNLGLLLVQLGFHVAAQFREALAPLGLEPRHLGTLRHLAADEGPSQQALGRVLGVNPNGMVFLIDELEGLGLVERRRDPNDRRRNALYLTSRGHQALDAAARATGEHGELGRSLTDAERRQLGALLRRLAAEQGVDELALPGIPPGPRTGRAPEGGLR